MQPQPHETPLAEAMQMREGLVLGSASDIPAKLRKLDKAITKVKQGQRRSRFTHRGIRYIIVADQDS